MHEGVRVLDIPAGPSGCQAGAACAGFDRGYISIAAQVVSSRAMCVPVPPVSLPSLLQLAGTGASLVRDGCAGCAESGACSMQCKVFGSHAARHAH